MDENLIAFIAGWIPAIILPLATGIQLYNVITKGTKGVSALTWSLFAFANVGAYIFTQKYFAPQAILAFALSAILDLLIVIVVLKKTNSKSQESE